MHRRRHPGRAVQVDPIKPTLKPPGTRRLKLKCHKLLSNVAFNFSMRRYILAVRDEDDTARQLEVRRHNSKVSKPVCKAPMYGFSAWNSGMMYCSQLLL